MTDYKLRVLSVAGTLLAEVTDFRTLAYSRAVNSPGVLQFSIDGNHTLLASLSDKLQVEVWRRPSGQAWARDFAGILRNWLWSMDGQGKRTYTATCLGIMSMIGWRVVDWYANTANRSAFAAVAAETISKTLVTYNCTASASTANGRIRAGTVTGVSVEADAAGGNAVDWNCHGQNVLESLQKLALIGGGDFDLVKTAAASYEFRWYAGQLGTDRTATVKFSLGLGNMTLPRYEVVNSTEKTAACVWGMGVESARATATRTGTNYNGTNNNIEIYVDAADVDTAAALNSRGDAALYDNMARPAFAFEALQSPNTQYGVHYFLGDLVTALNPYTGASLTQKVKSVSISLDSDGKENIGIGFETP